MSFKVKILARMNGELELLLDLKVYCTQCGAEASNVNFDSLWRDGSVTFQCQSCGAPTTISLSNADKLADSLAMTVAEFKALDSKPREKQAEKPTLPTLKS